MKVPVLPYLLKTLLKMKLLFIFAVASLNLMFVACESGSISEDFPSNEILYFESNESFFETLDSISTLSDSALCEWDQTRSFESLHTFFVKACNELWLSESEEKYSAFTQKYKSRLIFNFEDNEDYSVYCPVEDYYKCYLLNKDCEVVINGIKVCMKDYSMSNYPFEREISVTRGVESGINSIYVLANHRKLRVNYTYKPNFEKKSQFYISTRKKFLGGWASYDSDTYFEYPTGFFETYKQTRGITYPHETLNSGLQIKMWSDGVGSANKAIMTISNN